MKSGIIEKMRIEIAAPYSQRFVNKGRFIGTAVGIGQAKTDTPYPNRQPEKH